MSNFKRYKSKVFWNQMEALDAGDKKVLVDNREVANDIEEESLVLSLQIVDDSNRDSVPESDTTDPENVTVIHIDVKDSPVNDSPEDSPASACGVSRVIQLSSERSFSPASRGQRSQDSGFSDSDCSSNHPRSPRHHRRSRRKNNNSNNSSNSRRSKSLSKDNNKRTDNKGRRSGSLNRKVDALDVLTSTPKRSVNGSNRPRITTQQLDELSRHLDFDLDERTKGKIESTANERLEDFLYEEDEPPICHVGGSDGARNDYEPSPILSRNIIKIRNSNLCGYKNEQEEEEEEDINNLDPQVPCNTWLSQLRHEVEDECQATLQSKSLPKRINPQHRVSNNGDNATVTRDLRFLTVWGTSHAKRIIDAAERFERRYSAILELLSKPRNRKSKQLRDSLDQLENEATEILTKYGSAVPRRIAHQDEARSIAMQLARLKNNVDRAFDRRLDFYIEKVVRGLEEAPSETGSAARGALAALTALGLAGPRAASSITRCSGIRALLLSLVSGGRLSSDLRCACLRALASCCCCLEAIDQFVQEAGPEIITDLLSDDSTPDTEKSETAALLVQISSPWMDRVGLVYVQPYAQRLVRSLTDLAERTKCKQTLLLAAAAINHLSFSRKCIGPIVECDSIKKLLRCVKKSQGGNVWLMEQVASLIGQVARVPQARNYLAESRASVGLVCFLRMQPPGHEDEYRRLIATATEALTRLCVDPEVAKQVVAIGGTDCLDDRSVMRNVDYAAFKSTKSLRMARKIAAEQIGNARIWDVSPK